jgi:ribokinase
MKQPILVIGSANTDMVVRTPRFPQPGETLLGGEFFMFPGGKGANQAVAAARLQGDVTFICKLGNDLFGRNAIEGFRQEGLRTEHIIIDDAQPSGVALITVDAQGQNEIVVAPGANARLLPADLLPLLPLIEAAAIVVLQLEIPHSTVAWVLQHARSKTILNPAPAQVLPTSLYDGLFVITPNETETQLLTGIQVYDAPSAHQAAARLREWGIQHVVITMGATGVFVLNDQLAELLPAPSVQAIDTTAAGDVFNGALAVALSQRADWRSACAFACRAAAVSVTRMGAQTSAPYLSEIS